MSSFEALHQRGAKVSIADANPTALEKVAEAIGTDDIVAVKCDVRQMKEVEAWLQRTVDRWGKLDGAANMSGIFSPMPGKGSIEDATEEEWDMTIAVNLTGVMHCMKAELKWLKSGSAIVNAASVGGTRGFVGSAAYCASKHGVIGLTRASAKDFGPRGIRIDCIAPGYIDTPMQRAAVAGKEDRIGAFDAGLPIGRVADAEEAAKVVCFLLSDESSYVTGSVYDVDGGYQL
ncbi:unnamed protein product [Zymoseptoria tritici ST99CH_1E4]|uniref:Uncharacterized protein n=1 Tax=Zymoseptoria tritici ST99CH_1E4 TaxID=1276532 RepID=A0A2H1H595_ZYMTR|nr:unnamed protein product [Zymoseptoria tritici ST99CH_1E4]